MTSGGGGYCDCGDPEAWKQYPCCELHTPATRPNNDFETANSFESLIEKLPKDLAQRATELFQFLMEYVLEILCGNNTEQLPQHLRLELVFIYSQSRI